jgi:hypothetical protein
VASARFAASVDRLGRPVRLRGTSAADDVAVARRRDGRGEPAAEEGAAAEAVARRRDGRGEPAAEEEAAAEVAARRRDGRGEPAAGEEAAAEPAVRRRGWRAGWPFEPSIEDSDGNAVSVASASDSHCNARRRAAGSNGRST